MTKSSGAVNFSFSGDGSLLYVSDTPASTTQSVLVLVDRNGRDTPVTEITADYLFPRFSPDGRHVAFAVAETEGAARPYQLAGGISVALVTTCLGLIVAIPTMFFVSFFRTRIEGYVSETETVVEKLMGRFRQERTT